MNETIYLNIEPWMYSVMERFWVGQTWNQAIGNDIEKLNNPQMHGPYSIGKILIPEQCSVCQGSIGGYFASRSEFKEGLKWNRSATCIGCGHKPFALKCNCSPCLAFHRIEKERLKKEAQEKAFLEEAHRKELIKNRVQNHNQNVNSLEFGTYDDWAILLAMLVQSTSEDPFIITPLRDSELSLGTSPHKSAEAIQKVISYLQFLDDSPRTAVLKDDSLNWNGQSESYKVISHALNPKEHLLNTLRTCSFDCGDAECIALDIRALMTDEALEFLERTREEYGLPHQVGDKTKFLFNQLIIERPLGEIFFLIWRSCVDSAAAVQKKSISRAQASNRVIGEIERLHIRAKENGWQLKIYKRFNFGKQNWLSYVYFNLVLKLSGEGLEYSWIDVLQKQQLLVNLDPESPILGSYIPAILEVLKERDLLNTSNPNGQ
ncbi:hypothetical protein [Parachlamydia acanthamoebae]|uniref:hypothetical protein n=1 Tax=Parachlamydia acanthamoebae TaxID=83552 RepID=UPI000751013C|nr:hypothetical protein [Parachlamydia acanthamoebae]